MHNPKQSSRRTQGRKPYSSLTLLVLLIVSLLVWWGGGLARPAGDGSPTPTPAATVSAAATAGAEAANATATPAPPTAQATIVHTQSGLPTILATELPPEAQTTLTRIDAGGPFPFAKDGATFQNREGILPHQAQGYYHEYTVVTPGEDDRGARRIVAGAEGEFYYTADHYVSFQEIVR